MVLGKHDERLIQCARLLEKMKDSPHIVVDTLHHTKIFGHQTTQRRHRYLGIRRSPGRDLRIRFAYGIRNGNGHIIKERVIGLTNAVGAMWIRKTEHQEERTVLFLTDELQGTLCQKVRRESLLIGIIKFVGKLAFAIQRSNFRPAILEDYFFSMPPIEHEATILKTEESGWNPLWLPISIQVPFTDEAGSLTPLLKNGPQGGGSVWKRHIILNHPIVLRIETCQQGGPRGRTHRSRGVKAGTKGPLRGKSINMGCLHDGVSARSARHNTPGSESGAHRFE